MAPLSLKRAKKRRRGRKKHGRGGNDGVKKKKNTLSAKHSNGCRVLVIARLGGYFLFVTLQPAEHSLPRTTSL